ncbi:MAG: amino acid ABC transporter substrate-binding protein [Egibacteraceae bacterium]
MRTTPLLAYLLVLALLATACAAPEPGGSATESTQTAPDQGQAPGGILATVQSRGRLVCGVNSAVPGFGVTNDQGEFSGFDIDYCRAVAAGVLGDPDAVDFRPLDANQRFTALQSGEIDVLIRNTTWTASRDGGERAAFAHTTYYDGQGMMVRTGEFNSIDEMANTTVCTLAGTTTELNITTRFASIPHRIQTFDNPDSLQEAFVAGACDGWSSDVSQLAARRSTFPEGPDALTILDEVFSKEPLGPAVRDGDPQWFDVVNWIVLSTILAEELDITQANVEQMTSSDNADVRALLGQPGGEQNVVFDPGLGLDPAFAVNVIAAVGNYGEIFQRNIAPLGIDRGLNALWTNNGLQYASPFR